MKFTLQRKTDLAIRTLNVLAESGTRWRARELAGAIDSTPEFIPQVLAPLVRAGWVESRRGPTGGYRLQSTAISVRDVIEAVEGPIDTAGCVLRGVPCGTDGNCALHDAWSRALDALLRELVQRSVNSMAFCRPSTPLAASSSSMHESGAPSSSILAR